MSLNKGDCSMNFNFAHQSMSESDIQAHFNGFPPCHEFFTDDPNHPNFWEKDLVVHPFSNETTMAHIMVIIGMFPSVTQAKKNGRDGPIPWGFSMHKIGKKRISVAILNRNEDE